MIVIFNLETGLPVRLVHAPGAEHLQADEGEVSFPKTADMIDLSEWALVEGVPAHVGPS